MEILLLPNNDFSGIYIADEYEWFDLNTKVR